MSPATKVGLIIAVIFVGIVGSYFALVPPENPLQQGDPAINRGGAEPDRTAGQGESGVSTRSERGGPELPAQEPPIEPPSEDLEEMDPGLGHVNAPDTWLLGSTVNRLAAADAIDSGFALDDSTSDDDASSDEFADVRPLDEDEAMPGTSSDAETSDAGLDEATSNAAGDSDENIAETPTESNVNEDEPEQDETPGTTSPGVEPAPPPALPSAPPATSEYTVQQGDTLSDIAREWFGDASKWSLIAKANPLVDPNKLKVGQKLRLPPKSEPAPAIERSSDPVYVVKPGDTLIKIARAYYGDDRKQDLLYEVNREVIGSNPDRLKVGMKLRIPAATRGAGT